MHVLHEANQVLYDLAEHIWSYRWNYLSFLLPQGTYFLYFLFSEPFLYLMYLGMEWVQRLFYLPKNKKIVLIKEIVNFNLQDHTNYIFFFNSTFIFYQNVSANEVGSVGYELLRKYNLVDGYKDIWYVVRVYMCSDMRFVVSPHLKCMVLVKLVDKKYICHHSQYFTCCIYDNGKCNKKCEVIEIRI
jgi:hypothetical protein